MDFQNQGEVYSHVTYQDNIKKPNGSFSVKCGVSVVYMIYIKLTTPVNFNFFDLHQLIWWICKSTKLHKISMCFIQKIALIIPQFYPKGWKTNKNLVYTISILVNEISMENHAVRPLNLHGLHTFVWSSYYGKSHGKIMVNHVVKVCVCVNIPVPFHPSWENTQIQPPNSSVATLSRKLCFFFGLTAERREAYQKTRCQRRLCRFLRFPWSKRLWRVEVDGTLGLLDVAEKTCWV